MKVSTLLTLIGVAVIMLVVGIALGSTVFPKFRVLKILFE